MKRTSAPSGASARGDYAQYVAEMTAEARIAEKLRKTIRAGRLREAVRIVKRAALAEELDPTPEGIGSFE